MKGLTARSFILFILLLSAVCHLPGCTHISYQHMYVCIRAHIFFSRHDKIIKNFVTGIEYVIYSVTAAVFHIPVLTYLALASEIHRWSFVCAKILTGIIYNHFLSQIQSMEMVKKNKVVNTHQTEIEPRKTVFIIFIS